MPLSDHKFIFVSGMPRSATTALARLIESHPKVSGLTNTGVPGDEGEYLQTVYPKEDDLGGWHRFGLDQRAYMTETHPSLPGAGDRLFSSWAPYWDLSKPVLCEKTTNIARSRFLQAAFPNASFVFIVRHPIAQALAVLRWNYRVLLSTMIKNWVVCHRHLAEDLPHVKRKLVIRYEKMVRDAKPIGSAIERMLELEPGIDSSAIKGGLNDPYFQSWKARDFRSGSPHPLRNIAKRVFSEAEVQWVVRRYERDINEFGYSFFDAEQRYSRWLDLDEAPPAPEAQLRTAASA